MKFLFIHPVYGSQFHHIAQHLDQNPEHEVLFLSSVELLDANKRNLGKDFPPLKRGKQALFNYRSGRKHSENPLLNRLQDEMYQGQEVYLTCKKLRAKGYMPDVIICHNYWGAALYLKDIYPEAKLVVYSEYFSNTENVTACLEPGETLPEANQLYLRMGQTNSLITLTEADHIITPTQFQKSTHPEIFQKKISVLHDGIDSDFFQPANIDAIKIGERMISKKDTKIVTYIARNFESYRGFESFIKAAEILLREHPDVTILVGGGADAHSGYGGKCGKQYVEHVLRSAKLDRARLIFMGVLNHADYQMLLQLSDVHIYLTVPFVLSWSAMEAMACGCAIIGSDTAPVQEIITHGKNGLLAPLYAPQEIAAAVTRFLADKTLREKCSKAARKTILDRYATQKTNAAYERFLASL